MFFFLIYNILNATIMKSICIKIEDTLLILHLLILQQIFFVTLSYIHFHCKEQC